MYQSFSSKEKWWLTEQICIFPLVISMNPFFFLGLLKFKPHATGKNIKLSEMKTRWLMDWNKWISQITENAAKPHDKSIDAVATAAWKPVYKISVGEPCISWNGSSSDLPQKGQDVWAQFAGTCSHGWWLPVLEAFDDPFRLVVRRARERCRRGGYERLGSVQALFSISCNCTTFNGGVLQSAGVNNFLA